MKRTLLGTALLLALAQALPADAQNQVRLTFNRANGTAVSNVTVKVTNENGEAIDGVSATLQSIKQGVGTDANAAATDVALKSGNQLDAHKEILCANYTNTPDNPDSRFAEFTFKIIGLKNFSLNHSDLQIAALNGQGFFQGNKLPRKCDIRVWANKEKSTLIASKDGIIADELASGANNSTIDNTIDWEMKNSTTTQTTNDQYLVVRIAKSSDNKGCFFGLKQITLYNGYRFTPAQTANIDYVSTFSASNNVTFSSNATAYIATTVNDANTQVTLSPIKGALAAGKGAIVSTTAANDIYAYVSTEATDDRDNQLVGSGDETKELTEGNYYIFNKQGNDAVFSPLNNSGNTTLAANKAALKTPTLGSSALTLNFNNVTGISHIEANASTSTTTYDLSGRSVSGKLPAGLYIQNGKKIIVK